MKCEYAYSADALGEPISTHTYTYGDATWGDLLTAYDGVALTYDGSGNVTSFGTRNFSWTMGRQLSGITDTDLVTTYKYDVDGLRVQKTVNGVVTTYYRDGETLLGETTGNNTIIYEYDNGGAPVAFTYNGVKYYYVTNVLGDIVNICDASGNVVVSYTYDAWGNVLDISGTLADTIGQINPYRYRSYYYDSEIGYYYLQSRYYDPQIGRFINADDVAYLGADESSIGYNLFAYCNNNAINRTDNAGYFAIPWQIKVGLAAGVASAIWEMGKYIYSNWKIKKFSWKYVKGLGAALARGFIRGFVVGLLSTIPKAWIYGLMGGSLNLIFMIMDGKVKSVGAGISAFMDGWTKGVFTKSLSQLFSILFKGCKWKTSTKDLTKFATSTVLGYGISKFFKW